MIQFNLLPDIKQQYIKAERQKHLVVFVSTIASIAAIAIFVILLLVVDVWQKKSISDLNSDIKSNSAELSDTKDLNKILTVQNQLGSLTALHDGKPVASRMFDDLSKLTPANATISKMTANFTDNTVLISGSADSLGTVNTFTDTLKFTSYSVSGGSNDGSKGSHAFSKVVLSSFGKTSTTTTYTITASFDPVIFSEDGTVALTVPQITTTRSAIAQPTDLFKQTGN